MWDISDLDPHKNEKNVKIISLLNGIGVVSSATILTLENLSAIIESCSGPSASDDSRTDRKKVPGNEMVRCVDIGSVWFRRQIVQSEAQIPLMMPWRHSL
jgi:hypothetical protein